MPALVIVGLLSLPLLTLVMAFTRALLLFWPTMILLGAVHSHVPWVPAWGYVTTFLVVALLGLLVPTGNSQSSSD